MTVAPYIHMLGYTECGQRASRCGVVVLCYPGVSFLVGGGQKLVPKLLQEHSDLQRHHVMATEVQIVGVLQ
ncbi:hypothetical protein LPH56_02815 [Xylella taiwanensis]|uniref:hypothetical protein n=1 Tax=Xylella taiwanensis TaxID=1444770 RepID=UPI00135F197B|nr:hypothetical protein [Xylella taiwanensis]MCD8459738.1 hypothetical protein [Xylella taiwanensis]UFN41948.1 hypothetical protein LPH57_03735 [Xylella taiwanensis]UFS50098.1 hypothetical protein LPH54_02810 [Xylella taiwanensis]UFS52383.1 hypothetical protein LPH56_02815 [Xylella taiwanensis]